MFSDFCEFFNFSLTLYPVGAKISKRYSSLKSRFKLFLNFLLSGAHKNTVLENKWSHNKAHDYEYKMSYSWT